MTADDQNDLKYISGALLMHLAIAGVVAGMLLYSPKIVISQLGIKATLIDSNSLNPPKPQVDTQEQERLEKQKADQKKKEQEQAQEREEQQREKEKQEQLRLEQQQKEKAAEQKRIEKTQEVQRQKQEAEKKRVDEIKQKQRDVEQKRRTDADAKAQAAREAELKAQLAEEEGRDQAVSAGLLNQYAALIRQRVERNWIKPPSAQSGIKCEVRVTQAVGGMVLSVSFGKCNADSAVRQSIETAVMQSSPLPPPKDSRLFDRNLSFIFSPSE